MSYSNTTSLLPGLIDQIIDREKINDAAVDLEKLTETLDKLDYYTLQARLIKLNESTVTEAHETTLEAPVAVIKVTKAETLLKVKGLPTDWLYTPNNHDKKPLLPAWQNNGIKKSDIGKVFMGESRWKAIGVLSGVPSGGLLFLDRDGSSTDRLVKEFSGQSLDDALPKTVTVTSGRVGRCQHIYQVPEEYWDSIATTNFKSGVKGPDGELEQLEFFWDGHQSVVIGEHPKTGSYRWINSPMDTDVSIAPLWMIEKMIKDVPVKNVVTDVSTKSKAPKPLRVATETVSMTVDMGKGDIPLIKCIAVAHRDFIETGISEGGRNCSAFKVAVDLIGTENYLTSIDQKFVGSAKESYEDYCQKCKPVFDGAESVTTWNSALKDNPTKCLDDHKIQGCIEAWYRNSSSVTADNNIASGFDEALESLQAKENLKAELHDACFDDESIHGSEYYFKGIWAKIEGGILLNLMRNRYVALAINIDAKLLGLLPSGVKVRHPLAKYSSETLALFNFTSGDSNSGKKVLNKMIRQTLGRVGKQMDSERTKKQTIIINEFKAREGSESGSDSDTPKLNPKLVGVPPKSQLSDASPEAVQRLIASNQHFALLAPYTDVNVLPALGMCMSYSEGRTFINRWNLTDAKNSYSPSLNSLRDGEGEDLDRVTGDQYYAIKDGQLSVTIHIQPPFLNNIYRMERPSKKTPDAAVDGLGARLNVVLIEKDKSFDDEIDVIDEADHDVVSDESYKLNQLNGDLKLGIEQLQLHLIENPVIIWDRDAKELYCSMWRPWWKLMNKKHQRGLANYWGKLDSNLIATAGSKACQRWVNSWIEGNVDFKNLAPTELKITVADLEVAMVQCKLYAAHRIYTESILCDSEIKDELRHSETRTLKQDEDVILKRFSDPALLKVWVEDQIAMGRNTLRLICYSGINQGSRERMKTHNINVQDAVRAVLETLQPK